MKKTILAVLIILLSYSCSDDGKDEFDLTDDLSYLNFQNEKLKGVWYFSKVIKADGSIENYPRSRANPFAWGFNKIKR